MYKWYTTTTFIVNENNQRAIWNKRISERYSRLHQTPVYTLVANDQILAPTDLLNAAVFSLVSDEIATGLQKNLYLSVGMPILFTVNLQKYLGACNGSQGTLTGFIFDPENEVQALKVRVDNVSPFQIDGLDPNTIIVTRKKHRGCIKHRNTLYEFSRSQFPIQEGFCWTAHKAQGCTLDKAVLCMNDTGGTAAYVKLSRTKTCASTFILPGFTIENLKIKTNQDYTAWRKTLEAGILETNEVVNGIREFNTE